MFGGLLGNVLSQGTAGATSGMSGMTGLLHNVGGGGGGMNFSQVARSRGNPNGNLASQMPEMVVAAKLDSAKKRGRSIFV